MAEAEIFKGTVQDLGSASLSGRGMRYSWVKLAGPGKTLVLHDVVVGPNVSARLAVGATGSFLVQRSAKRCALAALKVGSWYAEDRNLLLKRGLAISAVIAFLGVPAAIATWMVYRSSEVAGVPLVVLGFAGMLAFTHYGPLSEGDYSDFRKNS